MVDLDSEVLLDGVDQSLRSRLGAVEGCVHPVRARRAGDREEQVARDGEDHLLPALVVGVQDHHRVAALALDQVLARLLRLHAGHVGAAVGPDEQHVEDVAVREQVGDLLLLDLGEAPPKVDVAAGRRQDGDDQEADEADEEPARPAPVFDR